MVNKMYMGKDDDRKVVVFVRLKDLERIIVDYKEKGIDFLEGMNIFVLQYDALTDSFKQVYGGNKNGG